MKTWNFGYNKSKDRAKKIYLKVGRVKSPALNGVNVLFTNIGFNHLVRKGRIPRTRNEQKRRFVLVPKIEKIISNPSAKIEYRTNKIKYYANRHGNKVLITSIAYFWTFVEKINDCTIRVVVRKLNDGEFHFFSVMGDNVKVTRGRKKQKSKKPS